MINRIRSRFSPIDGYLIFSQNTVYSTNIDRQSVYILMIYLTSMFCDAENGFIDLGFDTFFIPTKNSRQKIFVYHRMVFSYFRIQLIQSWKDFFSFASGSYAIFRITFQDKPIFVSFWSIIPTRVSLWTKLKAFWTKIYLWRGKNTISSNTKTPHLKNPSTTTYATSKMEIPKIPFTLSGLFNCVFHSCFRSKTCSFCWDETRFKLIIFQWQWATM